MKRKVRFCNGGDYYTAFKENSIIEITIDKNEVIDKEKNYVGYGKSVNSGYQLFQIVRGESLFPLENRVKRL